MLALDDMLQVKTTLHRKSLFLRHFLNPFSEVRRLWDTLLVIFILYQVLVEPYLASFFYPKFHIYFFPHEANFFNEPERSSHLWNPAWTVLIFLAYLIDVAFIIDYIGQFHSVKIVDGRAVVEENAIVEIYMSSFNFVYDSISILPIEFVAIAAGRPDLIFSCRAFLKIVRMLRVYDYAEYHAKNIRANTNLIWLCNLFVMILILEHWLACGWFTISFAQAGLSQYGTWVEEQDILQPGADDVRRYVLSVYWVTVTLTSVGYGDVSGWRGWERIVVHNVTY